MAEIKLPTMSYKDIGEKGARYALDEVEYKGLTIRQWADKITGGEYAPVVHGHNNNQTYIGADEFRCSKCGIHIDDWLKFDSDDVGIEEFEFKYCPNCGAKMDGEG